MSLKIEETRNLKYALKGILKDANQDGLTVEDEKEFTIDVLSMDKIKELIGKSVTITIANKEEIEE